MNAIALVKEKDAELKTLFDVALQESMLPAY